MTILDQAELAMKQTVSVGTAGLRLSGQIRTAIASMDEIIKIWENMDDTWQGNLVNSIGEVGVSEANEIYLIFKEARTKLQSKGI